MVIISPTEKLQRGSSLAFFHALPRKPPLLSRLRFGKSEDNERVGGEEEIRGGHKKELGWEENVMEFRSGDKGWPILRPHLIFQSYSFQGIGSRYGFDLVFMGFRMKGVVS
ncbi:hypothetical protein NPIL_298441 [Nephila pilipes]|uniref:Uncharacterized protein n=1 Tax=Nephila pilipes TaxID=299642 RepID=A0A8X6T6D1_NEPPI|nr:hypothetical protein NPIL_142561 [Nephila pilipes]GFT83828.1 hypothetical protein NPIL_298441 [Nephila pilipes]